MLEYQYQMINMKAKGIKTNLTVIGKEMEIEFDPETLHDALNDIKLLFKVWQKVKFMVEI